jgi:hypothetical protein
MPGIDLHTTTDPMVWATEFVRIVRENEIDVAGEDAEGFMVAWFSNLLGAAELVGDRGQRHGP